MPNAGMFAPAAWAASMAAAQAPAAAAAWAMALGASQYAMPFSGGTGWAAVSQSDPQRATPSRSSGANPPRTPPPPLPTPKPSAPAPQPPAPALAAGRGPAQPAAYAGQTQPAYGGQPLQPLTGFLSNPGASPAAAAPPPAPARMDVDKTAPAAPPPPAPKPEVYYVGDRVQYWSSSKKKWITTTVMARYEREGVASIYDLNCKKGASAELVRLAPPKALDDPPKDDARAAKVPRANKDEDAAQKSKPGQVINIEEEDEAAWAALEDAEKAVARALQTKLEKPPADTQRKGGHGASGTRRAAPAAGAPPAAAPGYGGSAAVATSAGSAASRGVKRDAQGRPAAQPGMKAAAGTARAPGLRWRHEVGDPVEYWSKKQRKWLGSVVQAVNAGPNGANATYDLNCKHAVAAWRVRKPRQPVREGRASAGTRKAAGPVPEVFKLGEQIRYWSSSATRWVKATVKEVHRGEDGKVAMYSLDVKPKVSVTRVRVLSTPATAPPPPEEKPVAKPERRPPTKPRSSPELAVYSVGDQVKYWSQRSKRWLEGVVETKREASGRLPAIYDVRCRKLMVKGVTAALMQPAQANVVAAPAGTSSKTTAVATASGLSKKEPASASKVFAVGDKLKYWSKKSSTWLPGVVQEKHKPVGDGPILYDLKCNKLFVRGVTARQLRALTKTTSGSKRAAAKSSKASPADKKQAKQAPAMDDSVGDAQASTVQEGVEAGAKDLAANAPVRKAIDLDADMGQEGGDGGGSGGSGGTAQSEPLPSAVPATVLDPEPGDPIGDGKEDGPAAPGEGQPVPAPSSQPPREKEDGKAEGPPGQVTDPEVPGSKEGQEKLPEASEATDAAQSAPAEGQCPKAPEGVEAYDPAAPVAGTDAP